MKRLLNHLAHEAQQSLSIPTNAQDLCDTLCSVVSTRRARPLTLRIVEMPKNTGVSGLWLDMTDRDIVIVDQRADDVHRLVILGHELWHMEAGHCGNPMHGPAVAARVAVAARADEGEDIDWEHVLAVAARTGFEEEDESDAETFGLLLGSRLRPWLDGAAPLSRDEPAGRIQASLAYRRGGARRP
jgi:hypothetical protein